MAKEAGAPPCGIWRVGAREPAAHLEARLVVEKFRRPSDLAIATTLVGVHGPGGAGLSRPSATPKAATVEPGRVTINPKPLMVSPLRHSMGGGNTEGRARGSLMPARVSSSCATLAGACCMRGWR